MVPSPAVASVFTLVNEFPVTSVSFQSLLVSGVGSHWRVEKTLVQESASYADGVLC